MKYYERINETSINFFRGTKLIDIHTIMLKNEQLYATIAESSRNLQYYLENGYYEISHEKYLNHIAYWKKTLKIHKKLQAHKDQFKRHYQNAIYARKTKSNSTH